MNNIDQLDDAVAAATAAAAAAEPFCMWDSVSFAEAEASAKETQEVLKDLLGKVVSRDQSAAYAVDLAQAVDSYRRAQARFEEIKALEGAWGSAYHALSQARKKALESLR
jgi:predicted nucleic acid-binding protein